MDDRMAVDVEGKVQPKVGRSHRMIAEALGRVREGSTVTVIALYNEGVLRLQNIARAQGATPDEMIKLVITKMRAVWDLESILSNNATNFNYFVDHAVIENNYCNMLNMLHRYDVKGE